MNVSSFLRQPARLALVGALLGGQAAYAQDDLWALEGHDPVSYFEGGEAMEGRSDLLVRFRGHIYHFANEGNLLAFEANPRGYLPQFGGLSAVDLADGREQAGSPHFFVIYEGALYLMSSAGQRSAFEADPAGIIAAARGYIAGR